MTVLLIDGVGHVREWEIPALVDTLLVPLPCRCSVWYCEDEAARTARYPVATFQWSAEPSYPPVYRQVFKGAR